MNHQIPSLEFSQGKVYAAHLVADNYELRMAERDLIALRSEVEALEQRLHEEETENDAIIKVCEDKEMEHKQTIDDLQNEISQFIKMKEEHLAKVTEMTNKVNELREDLDKENELIEKRQLELSDAKKEKDRIENEKKELDTKILEITKEKLILQKESEEIMKENNELAAQQNNIEFKKRKLEQEIIDEKCNYEQLNEKLSKIKTHIEELELQVKFINILVGKTERVYYEYRVQNS